MTRDEHFIGASKHLDGLIADTMRQFEAKLRSDERRGLQPVFELDGTIYPLTVTQAIASRREELAGWRARMLTISVAQFDAIGGDGVEWTFR